MTNRFTFRIMQKELTERDIDRIIEMAWEDRTPFDAIDWQFGLAGRWDGMSKGRELRSNVATWLRPEAFKIRSNGSVSGAYPEGFVLYTSLLTSVFLDV